MISSPPMQRELEEDLHPRFIIIASLIFLFGTQKETLENDRYIKSPFYSLLLFLLSLSFCLKDLEVNDNFSLCVCVHFAILDFLFYYCALKICVHFYIFLYRVMLLGKEMVAHTYHAISTEN